MTWKGSRRIQLRRRLLAGATALVLCWILVLVNGSPAAADELIAEYRIKAAYLYKFGSYVEWPKGTPDSEDDPFTIAIMGADEMAGYMLDMVRDRTVGGRPVEVRILRPGDVPPQGIQVLFVGKAAEGKLPSILASVERRPVLTVTESSLSQSAVGVINFVIVDNKVRFDIAPAFAEQRRLKISARLLEVARQVVEQPS